MFNAIYFYRIGNWFHKRKVPLIPFIIKAITYLIFNSVIPYQTVIGKQSKFAYGGIGVVIHSQSKIGKRVIIGQGVTIGMKSNRHEAPVIGDDVYISAGSRILGNIRVGNNVIIGANSVVLSDVPDNAIVAGVPATIIRYNTENIHKIMSEK